MLKFIPMVLIALAASASGCTGNNRTSGEQLFALHCASCHPDGGNTINPSRTLRQPALRANNINTPGDIVAKMRNPGPGMPRFSPAVIPDRDALRIAEHILASFR